MKDGTQDRALHPHAQLAHLWHALLRIRAVKENSLFVFVDADGQAVAEVAAGRDACYFVRTRHNHQPLGALIAPKLDGGEALVRQAVEQARASSRPFGQVLVELNPVAADVLQACLRQQIESGLTEIARLLASGVTDVRRRLLTREAVTPSFGWDDLWGSVSNRFLDGADSRVLDTYHHWAGRVPCGLLWNTAMGVERAFLYQLDGVSVAVEEERQLRRIVGQIVQPPCFEAAQLRPETMMFSGGDAHWLFMAQNGWALALRAEGVSQRNQMLSHMYAG